MTVSAILKFNSALAALACAIAAPAKAGQPETPGTQASGATADPAAQQTPDAQNKAGSKNDAVAADQTTTSQEEIVVTANRRSQRLIEVPMSITAVSQTELDRRGIEKVSDLAKVVPGLFVSDLGPGGNRIFIRGVGNGNNLTSLVGVYVDEIPVTGEALGQLDLQLNDLERVEVLRGPQGTLYGQGSAGGTIRFITRKVDLNETSGEVAATAYATQHGDPTGKLTGELNIPLVDNVLGIRATGTLAEIGGWIDQPDADRRDINNQHLRDGRIKALLRPADNLDIEANVFVHRNHGNGIPVGADKHYNVFFPNGDPTAKESFTDNFDIYNLTGTYDFGPVKLLSSTSYVKTTKHNRGISLRLPGFESFNADNFHTKTFSQEVRLSSADGGRLTWVVGAFYNKDTVDRLLVVNAYSGGVLLGEIPLPSLSKSSNYSIFGDAGYQLTEKLEVGAGLRYFHDRRRELSSDPALAATFKSVDPRLYFTYALAKDISIYGNVAKGFRSGGFLGDLEVSTFKPEKIWSYELGTKGSVHPFRWELSGFFSTYKDYQAFVQVTQIFGGVQNAGDARIYGVDWLLGYDPTPNLTFQLTGNVTRTNLFKVSPTATANIEGDRLDFIPDYSISASAEYRFNWSGSMPGYARVDYNQIGPATVTDRSLGFIAFKNDTVHLLNARIGARRGPWDAELFGQNLLGENGIQDPIEALGFGTRPRPRTAGITIRRKF